MPLQLQDYLKTKKKNCILCGINGSVRKHTFHLFGQIKVRVCVCCQESLDGPRKTAQYLETAFSFPKKQIHIHRIKKIIIEKESVTI